MYPEGPRTLWLPDANIPYLTDPKHLFLFIAGILILLVGTGYTFILFSWQWLVRSPNWKLFWWTRYPKLNSFIEAYHAPYSYRHRYWTGLLLTVRVALYLVSALNRSGDPTIPLATTVFLIGFLLLLDKNVYKKSRVGLMESSIYFNILVFAVFSWYTVDTTSTTQKLQTALSYISTLMILAQLLSIIIYHSYQYTKLQFFFQKTTVYRNIKVSNLRFLQVRQRNEPESRNPIDPQITGRDIDIFQLMDHSQDTNNHQHRQPPTEPPNLVPTATVIDIPGPMEDQPPENKEHISLQSQNDPDNDQTAVTVGKEEQSQLQDQQVNQTSEDTVRLNQSLF